MKRWAEYYQEQELYSTEIAVTDRAFENTAPLPTMDELDTTLPPLLTAKGHWPPFPLKNTGTGFHQKLWKQKDRTPVLATCTSSYTHGMRGMKIVMLYKNQCDQLSQDLPPQHRGQSLHTGDPQPPSVTGWLSVPRVAVWILSSTVNDRHGTLPQAVARAVLWTELSLVPGLFTPLRRSGCPVSSWRWACPSR